MKQRLTQAALLLLVLLMMFGIAGCTSNENEMLSELVQSLTQERKDLQEKLNAAQNDLVTVKQELSAAKADAESARQELTQLKNAPTPTPNTITKEVVTTVPGTSEYAIGVGCTVNGGMAVQLLGSTSVKCVPNNVAGYVFDHWEVDGVAKETTEKTLELTVSKTTVIQAVFHERHILKCINCHFQFLTDKGNASGKSLKEFDFEEDYTNLATKKKMKGGLISFYITADIPKRQEVDYWLINGVKYQFPNNVTKFRVENLDEATVYEVVFKNQTKRNTQTPSPVRPTPTPTRIVINGN
ncbi:MAG: hypothetical protein IJI34_05155 [Clostridia bacterium]|nr:hypothetical protein [Clostridia bacterium]